MPVSENSVDPLFQSEESGIMPELPDVAHFKSYFDSTALHQRIAKVRVLDAKVLDGVSPQRLQRSLKRGSFDSTFRHGKFLFARCDRGPHLVLHFGMTGYLDYSRTDTDEPKYARVAFHFEERGRLSYVCPRKLGIVALTEDPRTFTKTHAMGPDALDGELDLADFRERFSGRRGAVKSALMNQSILAGIGNVYADEILFQTGIHPGKNVGQLNDEDFRNLYRTMRRVLKTAARKHADISRLPGGYLLPHRDTGDRCPQCNRNLVKKKISGRATYLCPNCQR